MHDRKYYFALRRIAEQSRLNIQRMQAASADSNQQPITTSEVLNYSESLNLDDYTPEERIRIENNWQALLEP